MVFLLQSVGISPLRIILLPLSTAPPGPDGKRRVRFSVVGLSLSPTIPLSSLAILVSSALRRQEQTGSSARDQFQTYSQPSVSYSAGKVFIGHDTGLLVSDHYGPPMLTISKTPELHLNVSAERDKLCIIEQSPDLLFWSEVARCTNSTGTCEITGLSPTNSA